MRSMTVTLSAALAACAADPLPADSLPVPVAYNLEVSAVLPGAPLTLTASGLGGPGVRVTFLVSTGDGPGPCAPNGSACLDIGPVVRPLGSATTDAAGDAQLVVIAPLALPDGSVGYFQAAAREGAGWATTDMEAREVGDLGVCGDAVERPHDPALPEWSYHGVDDGPDTWGSLPGYETCGAGVEQTPIALETRAAAPGAATLAFHDYAVDVPLDLLDNGHTLQVSYTSVDPATDPRITYDGRTWYLRQFHVHSTSEHTLDGESFPFEIHLVHQATDGSRAVVGVLVEPGLDNTIIQTLLENDPGHHMATSCTDTIPLADLLPASASFFHYDGSLTTPPCDEGLDWFVMAQPLEASARQAQAWQAEFGGTTNRPLQALGGRTVTLR